MNGSNDLYFIGQGVAQFIIFSGSIFYAALIIGVAVSLVYEWIDRK